MPHLHKNAIRAALAAAFLLSAAAAAGCAAGGGEKKAADITSLSVYQDWTGSSFYTQEGKKAETPLGKEPVIFVYWASWCPHCQESLQEGLPVLCETAKEAGAALFLVDKLDGEKETVEAAEAFLAGSGIDLPVLYDRDAAVYEDRGLSMIPTVVALDAGGKVTSFAEGSIPGQEELASMAREAAAGKTAYLADALKKNLLEESGGLRTNYLEGDGSLPSGGDILSESQGLMLQYAAGGQEKELFDTVWKCLLESRLPAGLNLAFPWAVTEKQEIHTNAAVDELRIYRALCTAQKQWGGYEKELEELQAALKEYLVQEGRLVDFYDFQTEQKAGTFSLCYADLEAMKLLAGTDEEWNKVAEECRKIIESGKISEAFPLYDSRYDYAEGTYARETLNMAEELLLLLHLAEADCLPEEAWGWLRQELQSGAVYGGYDRDGRPAAGKRFESTAVYGLTAMIALEMGDRESAALALSRMDAFRVRDSGNRLDGLFGGKDGNGIYSFDQCIALRAYQRMDGLP